VKYVLLLSTLIVSLTVVSDILAISKPTQESPPETGNSSMEIRGIFSGVIEKIDENGETIAVKERVPHEVKILFFTIDSRTKITKRKTSLTPQDLKKDMMVIVEYRRAVGKLIAVTIDVKSH